MAQEGAQRDSDEGRLQRPVRRFLPARGRLVRHGLRFVQRLVVSNHSAPTVRQQGLHLEYDADGQLFCQLGDAGVVRHVTYTDSRLVGVHPHELSWLVERAPVAGEAAEFDLPAVVAVVAHVRSGDGSGGSGGPRRHGRYLAARHPAAPADTHDRSRL